MFILIPGWSLSGSSLLSAKKYVKVALCALEFADDDCGHEAAGPVAVVDGGGGHVWPGRFLA